MAVDHFMVDFETSAGDVAFANAEHLNLAEAKALAARVSKEHGAAHAVAFQRLAGGSFEAVGHVPFFDGVEDVPDGVVE